MSVFCACGVTLMGDPGEGDGLCATCAAAPHGRDCSCDECEAYWARVAAESVVQAEAFNRQLVCSCGWTGPFIEHHRERRQSCVVGLRKDGRVDACFATATQPENHHLNTHP